MFSYFFVVVKLFLEIQLHKCHTTRILQTHCCVCAVIIENSYKAVSMLCLFIFVFIYFSTHDRSFQNGLFCKYSYSFKWSFCWHILTIIESDTVRDVFYVFKWFINKAAYRTWNGTTEQCICIYQEKWTLLWCDKFFSSCRPNKSILIKGLKHMMSCKFEYHYFLALLLAISLIFIYHLKIILLMRNAWNIPKIIATFVLCL